MRGLIASLRALAPGKRHNRAVGQIGETLAARLLHRKGHRLLERNWRSKAGEIDLISALADGTIVFTEVKTRRGEDHGEPLEAVDDVKRDQVMRVSSDYLRRWRLERRPVRYDLIGITFDAGRAGPRIEHIEGIL